MPVPKKVNKNFFKKWSPEMAYVLGFFAADGTITINSRGGAYFVIQIADKAHLKKLRDVLGSEHKISKRIHKNNGSIFYRLQIGSKEICEDLRKLGFEERKTHRLTLPRVKPKSFPHFLRGYFDGDGNVWTGLVHKDRETQTWTIQTAFTSCSQDFLQDLHIELKKYGIKTGQVYKRMNNAYCLKYSVNDSILLSKIMYGNLDSNLFLKRKKKRFDKFVQMRS